MKIGIYTGLCAAVLAFVAFYLAREDLFYMWDFAGYHSAWIDSVLLCREQGPLAALGMILRTIRTCDYNYSSLVPLLPWGCAFGCTRFSYLAGVTCLYFVPAGMLISEMIFAQLKGAFAALNRKSVYALVFLSAPLWHPFLRGLVDVVVLLPFTVAVWLFLKDSFVTKRRPGAALALGLCLYLGFLLRRWMSLSLMAFAVAALPFAVRDFLDRSVAWREKTVNVLLHGLCAALGFFVPMAILQFEEIVSISKTDYGLAHAAWNAPLPVKLQALSFDLNPYVLAFLAASGLVFLFRRRMRARAYFFCGLHAVAYVAVFMSLQRLDIHHLYGLLPTFLLLLASGFFAVSESFARWPWMRRVATFVLYAGFAGLWFLSFVPTSLRSCDRMHDPFPRGLYEKIHTTLPLRYAGQDELIRFVYRFDELLREDPRARYANLGCGLTMNAHLQRVLGLLLDEGTRTRSLDRTRSRHLVIDSIDTRTPAFPHEILSSPDYLIVVSPFEGHADFRYHQICYRLCKALVTETGVGRAYERVMEQSLPPQCVGSWNELNDPKVREILLASRRYVDYRTDGFVAPTDMKLVVYRRKRPVTGDERVALADEIQKAIDPALKPQFASSIAGLNFLASAEIAYDRSSNLELVKSLSNDTIMMHPWTTPSTVTLHPKGRYRSMHVSFASQDARGDVVFYISLDGVEFRRDHVSGGGKVEFDLPLSNVDKLVFAVDCNGTTYCDTCNLTITDVCGADEKKSIK